MSGSELREEADVVFVEELDVRHAVLEHRDAIEAEAEGEAGVALGVVADVLEDDRVDHPAAQDLEPTRALADAARGGALGVALPGAAEHAAEVDLGTRLDEGEVA